MPTYLKNAKSGFTRFSFCREVIPFSAISGEGRSELLDVIAKHVLVTD